MAVWLRRGEIQAKEIIISEFDKRKFKETLFAIKELAYSMPKRVIEKLQKMCAECGVVVVITKNLPKAPISGATRWFHNKPIIQLSDRFQLSDHFWFTFFHEAAHILLHGKKDIFLDNVEGTLIDLKKEDEANNFAANLLMPDDEWQQIIQDRPVTKEKIVGFSKQFKTPAGVIVGRLQRLKVVPYHFGNDLKQKIDLT